MKKWIGLLLSLLLMGILFLLPTLSTPFNPVTDRKNLEKQTVIQAQDKEKEGSGDTYSVTLLKQIREKVEGWLKSLNDKIENEEVTHFEVRFYEILRSILEWVKEKIDAKIEAPGEKPKKENKGGLFRETRHMNFVLFDLG